MTELDVSRAPVGEAAAQELVAAVAAADDRIERHYLEVKGALDLTSKKDQTKLAKFILGAANRMPDVAARAFKGYAVLVIGVADGKTPGVGAIEALDLQKAIQPYIGADGPRWDVIRVPADSADDQREVLVLLVDPPEWGQDPFVCRKSGESSLRDGAVFVRAEGETREANHGELQLLVERAKVASPVAVDFEIRVTTAIPIVTVDETSTLEAYIARERSRLEAALPRTAAHSTHLPVADAIAALSKASAFASALQHQEDRTEDQYRGEIDEWEDAVRAAWPAVVRRAVGLLKPTDIEVSNRTKTFLSDVELKVSFADSVLSAEKWNMSDSPRLEDFDLPEPPRPWGPYSLDLGLSSHALIGLTRDRDWLPSVPVARSSWHVDPRVVCELSVGSLRPMGADALDDDEMVLYLVAEPTEPVKAEWEITARDHHEVYKGTVELPVGDVVDLTSAFRTLLGLADDHEQGTEE